MPRLGILLSCSLTDLSASPASLLRPRSAREDGGEPPNRSRQVDLAEQRLPAVPLQVEAHRVRPGPSRQRLGQRHEQRVVDLRAVARGTSCTSACVSASSSSTVIDPVAATDVLTARQI